ncbi:pentatricopeptide repeat-containing protein At4g21300 [Malania oleifera]|uniref:pentatricopeptide repeat-containing protein At4g21300 n=1 Tax=Malania oleifera TaxID=397392 RepID=UPI0025AE80FA|nr:pentatricopeptide repeat-containing protein At4g21300 [Malania oleifera]
MRYHKNLHSICKRFTGITTLQLISSHTTCKNLESVVFPPNTPEALSAHIASILQNFSDPGSIPLVRQVHAQVIVNGIGNVGFLGSKILGVYVLCGSFMDARNTFFQLDLRYASPWNWMIRAFTMTCCFDFALLFYFKMLGCGTSPDKYTFPYVIKACGGLNDLSLGKLIHNSIRLMGFEIDVFVGSSLINFYANNGCIDDARLLFDKMPYRDCALWNVMLSGYVKGGDTYNSLWLFREMRNGETKPNSVTYASMLSVCASQGMINLGSQLHGLVNICGLEMDSLVANSLLSMYAKGRNLSDARKLFDTMHKTDLVTWNGIIAGYVQNGLMDDAAQMFDEMISSGIKPDLITFASFLPSVTESASLKQGKEIHGYVVRHGMPLDVFLKSALIDVYFKCRNVEMARNIFNQSTAIDIVVCTAMISGYVLNGMNGDALEIFQLLLKEQMRPNSVTLASVLPACAGLAALKLGKELHCNILKNGQDKGCYVGSAITDMYAKCGRLDLAHKYFVRMPEKDAICWNSMITSCAQNGKPEEAIDLFHQMGMEGASYDCVSISAALSACANLAALRYGKEIHGFMMGGAFSLDLYAESALIDMYAKCGKLDFAHRVFNMMQGKSEVSWNTIIAAYGSHGCLRNSIDLFHEMVAEGIQPDHVTFLAIMSACAHAGQVDEGICYFQRMTQEYGITARMEHYACMVDLFGRAGCLCEAVEVIKSMPFNPDAGIWGTLLGACRIHGNVELAEFASGYLFDLDPQNSGYYMLLANVHADAGQWHSVCKIRSMMKERRVQKVPGYSWIEVNNITHMFVAADDSHPRSAQIYLLLNNLLQELRKYGYNAPRDNGIISTQKRIHIS